MVYLTSNWNSEEIRRVDFWRGVFNLIKDSDPIVPNDIKNVVENNFSIKIKHIKNLSDLKKSCLIDRGYYLRELSCSIFERNSEALSKAILNITAKRPADETDQNIPYGMNQYSPYSIWKSWGAYVLNEFQKLLYSSILYA